MSPLFKTRFEKPQDKTLFHKIGLVFYVKREHLPPFLGGLLDMGPMSDASMLRGKSPRYINIIYLALI